MFGQFARDRSYDEFRKTGVHRFQLHIPDYTKEIKLKAYYQGISEAQGRADVETTAFAAYAPLNRHIHVSSSNREINVGEYVVFHAKVILSSLKTNSSKF